MCDYSFCANKGCFEGTCPGSDTEEEVHHCVLCGWLTWDAKSLHCDACNKICCPNCWQNTFVSMTECETVELPYEWICSTCFLIDKEMWCKDEKCSCPQKVEHIRASWKKHLSYLKI